MDHQNFMFYLDRTRRDINRKMRYESEDPLWAVAERGSRWAGWVRALPRRLVHAALVAARPLRPRLWRERRQLSTPD